MSPAQVLQGQRAIVTGGSSGIGAAIAKAFGAAGAKVGVNYASNARDAQLMVEEIRKGSSEAIALGADVSDEAQVKAMFERFVGEYGGVDIVVANAGIQIDASFAQMEVEQFNRVLHVNLTGQFLCAREGVRRFIAQGPTPHSRALGKITVAEGVETSLQLEAVRGIGCDLVQGFLTGRPVPLAELLDPDVAGSGGLVGPASPRSLAVRPGPHGRMSEQSVQRTDSSDISTGFKGRRYTG